MFTLGIFTTHLPYIILVVFYAFFWIFGVDKASAGELSPGESLLSVELSATETIADADPYFSYQIKETPERGLEVLNQAFHHIAFQRIIHNGYYLFKYYPCSVYAVLFSRPPPLSL